ncbi:MAG: radical SAM protein [Deltaproteobacteria bacterium]|nr:radical SAM protein [Deltaproteobacteria bacterium]
MTSRHAQRVESKLRLLAGQARFDIACACGLDPGRERGLDGRWIYPTVMPDGSRQMTLKVLMDNACTSDCSYCAQRAGRDTPRDRFRPEELARLLDELIRAGLVKALFLSSGLGSDAVRSMDRMLDTVAIVRRRYAFRGFVHLKVLPGAQRAQVEQAARLAQRLSVNLEAPNARRLRAISERKALEPDILERMGWIADAIRDRRLLAKGHTTQFVIGAADETDAEIVTCTDRLYRDFDLGRAYYSKFQPVAGTPLEGRPPAPFMREHRLYQVDFLLRKYGFARDEIPFEPDGNLSLAVDPKTRWAQLRPGLFPVEVNRAEREVLLRTPGLGPVSVERILAARCQGRIRSPAQLARLGVRVAHAAPYLLLDGRPAQRQLALL